MDRGILVGNRLCARRLEEAKHVRHIEKLQQIKPGIDNRSPVSSSFTHLRSNPKREQLIEENYNEIDRANRKLLERMKEIIRKPSESSCLVGSKKGLRSLNRESRKKELKRITNENLSIMKRIHHAQSTYDHVSWEQDFRKTREYMKNSCELPVVLGRTPSGILQLTDGTEAPEVILDTDQIYREEGVDPTQGPRPEFRYLAKDGRRIGDTFYLIEVSSNTSGGLLVTAFSGQEDGAADELELELDDEQHLEVRTKLGGDYSKLIDKIRIRNGRISLLPF
jgi:hypothetical protein